MRIVGAGDQHAVILRDARDELLKGALHLGEGREHIGMIVFEVGQHGDGGRQTQKHIVVFIGFDHEGIAAAVPRVIAAIQQRAANDIRWIAPRLAQYVGDQGCGGRFAVRASHGDLQRALEEQRQRLAPPQDGDARAQRRLNFRVFGRDSRGDQHHIGRLQVRGGVSLLDLSAQRRQRRRLIVQGAIRAAHTDAAPDQHARDGAHARPADPDDMDVRSALKERRAQLRRAHRAEIVLPTLSKLGSLGMNSAKLL